MPERIRLSRSRGWRMPEGAVKVDRTTIWGNPWRAGMPGVVLIPRADRPAGWEVEARTAWTIDAAHAVHLYRRWLEGEAPQLPAGINARGVAIYTERFATRRSAILNRLAELRGCALACWCPLDASCHSDVLLELANG